MPHNRDIFLGLEIFPHSRRNPIQSKPKVYLSRKGINGCWTIPSTRGTSSVGKKIYKIVRGGLRFHDLWDVGEEQCRSLDTIFSCFLFFPKLPFWKIKATPDRIIERGISTCAQGDSFLHLSSSNDVIRMCSTTYAHHPARHVRITAWQMRKLQDLVT